MSGRPFLKQSHPGLARLAIDQADVATRAQLGELGIDWTHVRYQLLAERWREVVPDVLVLHTGPLTPRSLRWVALLAAGPQAALCSWTALECWRLQGWERPEVHLVVPRGRHVPRPPGVVVHESRRHGGADIVRHRGVPVHSVERAAVDAGAWSGHVRTACGVLAAVVQQGLTRPSRLVQAVDAAGRVRFRKPMLAALVDIEGGAQALSEIDIARLCRQGGLPQPTRQRVRHDVNGKRRYLDAEWDLADGRVVVLEIDGIGHMEPGRWYDDLMRQAELEIGGLRQFIHLPASAARLEPARVQAILARALGVAPAAAFAGRLVSTRQPSRVAGR